MHTLKAWYHGDMEGKTGTALESDHSEAPEVAGLDTVPMGSSVDKLSVS